jgi:uncharacterized membrane protein YidH (DUF202 family)
MLLNILVIWGILFLSAGAIVFMAFYPYIRSNKAKKTNIKSVSVFILVVIALLLFSLCLIAPFLFL